MFTSNYEIFVVQKWAADVFVGTQWVKKWGLHVVVSVYEKS